MADTLPISAFDCLLSKLANVLEISQRPEGTTTTQSKQALLHATNDFKDAMRRAQELAHALPGGDLCLDEQDAIIAVLERLKERKQSQLAQFSGALAVTAGPAVESQTRMEVDSTASTPA